MDKRKIVARIEQDLSFFMISEMCKNDPALRSSSEIYKYKGLAVDFNDKAKNEDKVMSVRIGALEAQFKIETGDKVFGNLMPNDEKSVMIWMGQAENTQIMKSVFHEGEFRKKTIQIVPFDLENFYTRY